MTELEERERNYKIVLVVVAIFALIPILYLILKAISYVGSYENISCFLDCSPREEPLSLGESFEIVFMWGLILFLVFGWIYYLVLLIIAGIFISKLEGISKKEEKVVNMKRKKTRKKKKTTKNNICI